MASTGEVSVTAPSEKQANTWLSISEKNLASTKGDDPSVNPWLATPYKKPSKNSNSDNRINKIQNKRKRLEQANEEDAQINIDVSIETINSRLKSRYSQTEQDEDTPNMAYGRGRIAFQQQELINRAFAGDGFEQDFALEKEAAIAEDAPKQEDLTLPGWGSWTGQGVKRRATERMLVKNVPGIDALKRKDAKLKNVIINEKTVKKVCEFEGDCV
jgi:U3 small nucleolar RNA-associated protein 14